MTIATYDLPQDMIVAKAKLEANGIECFVKDELTAQVHNFLSHAMGGVKLQVLEKDVDRSVEILNDVIKPDSNKLATKLRCPNCGSKKVDGIGWKGRLAMIFMLVFFIPIPFKSTNAKCFDCQNEFKI